MKVLKSLRIAKMKELGIRKDQIAIYLERNNQVKRLLQKKKVDLEMSSKMQQPN
jgi:hypothetical protein